MNPTFVKPRYDSGGFACLPGLVQSIFDGKNGRDPTGANEFLAHFAGDYDNVVLCFVDGFGWRHFEKFGSYPFLQRFARLGGIAKLTSQFPSTTSGHITCIHTGLNVGQSGVFEWNYYEPLLDAMIVPLLFSFSGTAERDQLKATGIDPKLLYPTETIYQKLNTQGVASTIFQHREYTPSTYSNLVFRGAQARGYKSLPEALLNLSLALNQARGRNYFFIYYDRIDSVSHDYGPGSEQVEVEVDMFMHVMESQFMQSARPKGKTLFLFTADHGQSEIDPATTVYINRAISGFEKFIRTNRQGQLLVPGGSCRDLFLYIKDDSLDEAKQLLAISLAGKADVVRTDELVAQGYFGPQITETFRARVGNLVVLPYHGESVWWYERGKFEQKYYGHHGGLTPAEMEIPLLGLEL
ncbi:MAG TPA: alkaline phosphatase family protein [Anaerolineales bacterium]|jgi:predicted AlkP superfamily pyrophosphatase or phosphodiesterase